MAALTFDVFVPRANNSSKIILNTVLSGSISGLVSTYLKPYFINKDRFYDIAGLCNGILAGLVSVTAVCHDVPPYVAFFIGTIGGVVYCFGIKFITFCKVDDPVEASVVHGCGGLWGVIAAGLFNQSSGLLMYYYSKDVGSAERLMRFGY